MLNCILKATNFPFAFCFSAQLNSITSTLFSKDHHKEDTCVGENLGKTEYSQSELKYTTLYHLKHF